MFEYMFLYLFFSLLLRSKKMAAKRAHDDLYDGVVRYSKPAYAPIEHHTDSRYMFSSDGSGFKPAPAVPLQSSIQKSWNGSITVFDNAHDAVSDTEGGQPRVASGQRVLQTKLFTFHDGELVFCRSLVLLDDQKYRSDCDIFSGGIDKQMWPAVIGLAELNKHLYDSALNTDHFKARYNQKEYTGTNIAELFKYMCVTEGSPPTLYEEPHARASLQEEYMANGPRTLRAIHKGHAVAYNIFLGALPAQSIKTHPSEFVPDAIKVAPQDSVNRMRTGHGCSLLLVGIHHSDYLAHRTQPVFEDLLSRIYDPYVRSIRKEATEPHPAVLYQYIPWIGEYPTSSMFFTKAIVTQILVCKFIRANALPTEKAREDAIAACSNPEQVKPFFEKTYGGGMHRPTAELFFA